jgi:predicted transcriptional regulator
MRKKAAKNRNISPVQTTLVPVKVRAQLTRLARQENVTVSEISRKAITEFVERNAVAQADGAP